jgi:hypothetical protein
MTKFGSVLTLVGSTIGALLFVVGFFGANGAPQEAAAAAAGLAFAAIPYCFGRALFEVSGAKDRL